MNILYIQIFHTFDRPVYGNFSKYKLESSPVNPFLCPSKILAALTVATDIPSPKNIMTFLAMETSGIFDS